MLAVALWLPSVLATKWTPDKVPEYTSSFDRIEYGNALQDSSENGSRYSAFSDRIGFADELWVRRLEDSARWALPPSNTERAVLPDAGPAVIATGYITEASETCPEIVYVVFGATAPSACRIAYCESHFRDVVGDSGASLGMFQIQPRFHQAKADALFGPGADLLNREVNVRTAYVISSGGTDWSLWSCRTHL